MAALALNQPRADRATLFAALRRRNRVVALLRLLVPLAGALLFAGLMVQIVLDNLGERFGFANIRIDRDNLVVEAPQVTSTSDNGTRYAVTARTARVGMTDAEQVVMSDAAFSMAPLRGASLMAAAGEAELALTSQVLTVRETLDVSSSDGMVGRLSDVTADLLNWQLQSAGPVSLSLPDGSQLEAAAMHYDGQAGIWQFERVTVTLAGTPGATEEVAE